MITAHPNSLPCIRESPHFLVSGGVDSIATVHWYKIEFCYYRPETIVNVLHFNHKVQEANDKMEAKVRAFCKKFNMNLTVLTRNNSQFPDVSEKGLREWRLFEMSKIGGYFVTGHHLDDAVENYLMNCFKGNPDYVPFHLSTTFTQHEYISFLKRFTIIHPWLTNKKEDIVEYAKEQKLYKWIVEDPTNHDGDNYRSFLRTEIIPALSQRQLNLYTVVRKKLKL